MNFTKQIKSLRKLQLKYESDFDTNGILNSDNL
jgi:hypothetical protein